MLLEYETDRLVLKILKPEYAQLLLDFYLQDKELFERYEPDRAGNFYTIPYLKTLMKDDYNLAFKQLSVRFYVFLKGQPDKIIGTVCFRNITKGFSSSCSLGYKFSSAYHHKGYATESIRKAIYVIFSELGLHRISAFAMPENEPSILLLKRLGFRQEGLCRGMWKIRNKWQDHLQYSLLSTDFAYRSSRQNQ